ncbi:nuclear transport factor 2 family protein [Actinoplanes sp. NPDC023936]|uniref:nuclear transport factor 2 family protein n=1 Tax=Actinoplanes sp. NPDC023936 TaxID=3154910 RepID=UPI0033C94474
MQDSEAGRLDADHLEADLRAAEQALQTAQRHGDVAALDALLDDRLIAIGPDGGRYTKQDDLDAYRKGTSVIDDLVQESLEHLVAGSTGVTFFTGTVSGTFGGAPVTARMRYTRTWTHTGGRWRVLAAHIVPA